MEEKLRSEIDDNFKWDLTKFCKDDNDFQHKFKNCEKLLENQKKYKGQLGNLGNLRKFYDETNTLSAELNDIYMYANHHANEDLSNSHYSALLTQVSNLASKIGEELSFVEPELLALPDEYLLSVASDPHFSDESFFIRKLLRQREHILSESEEKILSGTGAFANDFCDIMETYFAVNFTCDDAQDSDGNNHSVSDKLIAPYLFSTDRILRKNALNSYTNAINNINTTMSKIFIASLKKDFFYAKTRGYPDSLVAKLFDDNMNVAVYDRLLNNAHKKLDIVRKYYTIKAQVLGYPVLEPCDRLCPMTFNNQKYSLNTACEILRKALLPLGEDYVATFDTALRERWFDFYPNKNKCSGAYQSGAYGKTPVIMLNFTNDYNSVGTIAHEFGHAMHSVFTDKNQGRKCSEYTIFCAEIASTTNEVLLNQYCKSQAKTDEEKVFFLDSFVKDFISTFFRQAMFAEFERFAHNLVDKDLPISDEILNNEYARLNKEYLPAMENTEILAKSWVCVPHFYHKFYVWQYATGIVCAINFASKILNHEPGALENYYKFLSAGGSDYSLNILANCGIDLNTDEPYEVALSFVERNLDELEKIAKK